MTLSHLPVCLQDTTDLERGFVPYDAPDEDLPGADAELPSLVLRHLGGALGEVIVMGATEDGCLHVKWRGGVGGTHILHVLRQRPKSRASASEERLADLPPLPASCLLWKSSRAKLPLPWSAFAPEEAVALWRRMMNRTPNPSRSRSI